MMGTTERDGIGLALWAPDIDSVELGDGGPFSLTELVQEAAGVPSPCYSTMMSCTFADSPVDEDGFWREILDEYQTATGRTYPPVYRIRIRVEAEPLSNEACADWWRARRHRALIEDDG